MNSNYSQPVNLGNPEEYTIEEFAILIRNFIGNNNEIIRLDAVQDDPQKRRPDISTAMRELNWKPKVKVIDGIRKTVEYFRNELSKIREEEQLMKTLNDSEQQRHLFDEL
jgi:UDP-glucuronate decarboxylase